MNHQPHLSPARQELVVHVARLRYGCIENIVIRRGEPDLSEICVVRDVKLGGRESPRAQPCESTDLKRQFSHLWEVLNGLGDQCVAKLDVQDGLPFRIRVYETPAKRHLS